MIWTELNKPAICGLEAPNPELFSVDGSVSFRLLDFAQDGMPLVVNFGSYTCPVFRARLGEFGELVESFKATAKFVTVYVKEAHPTDEWFLKNNETIRQHKSLMERCDAAKKLLGTKTLRTPLLVDTMENAANEAYGAVPTRLYIIQSGIVQYAGGIGPTFYRPWEVKKWLE
ncbi:predicted protein, partial [Nematostella vectensis]